MQLYQGDHLEVMRNIPDNSIDMVLCDLPYGTTYYIECEAIEAVQEILEFSLEPSA